MRKQFQRRLPTSINASASSRKTRIFTSVELPSAGPRKEYDKVFADCTAVLLIRPDDVDALRLWAEACHSEQEFDKVIADCTAILRRETKDVSCPKIEGPRLESERRVRRGDRRLRRGHLIHAQQTPMLTQCEPAPGRTRSSSIRQSLTAPRHSAWILKNASVFSLRGWSWSRKGEFEKATKDYEEAFRLDPNDKHAREVHEWNVSRNKEYVDEDLTKNYLNGVTLDPPSGEIGSRESRIMDTRKEIDDSLGTTPIECANDTMMDNRVVRTACDVSTFIDLVPAPQISTESRRQPLLIGRRNAIARQARDPTSFASRPMPQSVKSKSKRC